MLLFVTSALVPVAIQVGSLVRIIFPEAEVKTVSTSNSPQQPTARAVTSVPMVSTSARGSVVGVSADVVTELQAQMETLMRDNSRLKSEVRGRTGCAACAFAWTLRIMSRAALFLNCILIVLFRNYR